MQGTIQVSFSAKTREELPVLPFGSETKVILNDIVYKAFVSKGTFRDLKQKHSPNREEPHEVQYTLDVTK